MNGKIGATQEHRKRVFLVSFKNKFNSELGTTRILIFCYLLFGSAYNLNQVKSMAYDAIIYKCDEDMSGPKSRGGFTAKLFVCV